MPKPLGRPKAKLTLTDEEKQTLLGFIRRGTVSQRTHLRARIILECASGKNNATVAEELQIDPKTVCKWRKRFVEYRLYALADAPRNGRPRTLGDDKIEEVIRRTLETMPKGASRWSTREMARNLGIDRTSVSRIWRAFGLKPHRSETFQLSTDPDFINKVHDVVGLYMSPPHNAVVLSVDEKTAIQALNRTQPMLPLTPGQIERKTPEYKRHGTSSLFAALDVSTGSVIGKCYRRHRATEFLKFLKFVDNSVASNFEIHLILDNYATHKSPAVMKWLVKHRRFHLHFIPTHSSWLNQVECWFSILTEKQLKRGSHQSVIELEKSIYEFLDAHNEAPAPFKWTKTADEIVANVAKYCGTILELNSKQI
ncbi:MAG: IS630 family transposase [bacterium]|nr:IS630 family transposase [bacterium]